MSTYTKIKTLPLSLFNNAEYLSFMNHVLDLANGNSGGGDSESPDEISLLTGSDGIPELGLTKEFLDTYEADGVYRLMQKTEYDQRDIEDLLE